MHWHMYFLGQLKGCNNSLKLSLIYFYAHLTMMDNDILITLGSVIVKPPTETVNAKQSLSHYASIKYKWLDSVIKRAKKLDDRT